MNFEISTIEKLEEVLATYPNLAGFNVTIPYKLKIIDYLDARMHATHKRFTLNGVPSRSISATRYSGCHFHPT